MKKYCFKSILALAALMTFCPVMAEEPIYNMPDQRRGDVNKDGNVDISDIVAVINHISGNVHYIFSNVNGDEHVDISDITAIINIISDSSEPDLLEWEDLGTGTFTDNFWEEGSCSVELFQCKDYPNVYRVVDPYGQFGKEYYDDSRSVFLDIEILHPGDNLFGTEITQSELVYFEPFNTGYLHSSYKGYINLYHPSHFKDEEESFTYNRVVLSPKAGVPEQIKLAPYFYIEGIGAWNHTQDDGVVTIQFPGYTSNSYIDMKMESRFKGILTGNEGEVYAMTDLLINEYAEKIQFAVVPESAEDNTVADDMLSGRINSLNTFFSNPSTIDVPIPDGMSGKLKVVFVVTDSSQKSAFSSISFEYDARESTTWKALGTGLYTDNFLAPGFNYNESPTSVTYEVEVLESNEKPGVYRMRSPYGISHPMFHQQGIDKLTEDIEINATDPDGVILPYQPTGIEYFSHIASYGGYLSKTTDMEKLKAEGYLGKLSDGIITLPTFYDDEGIPYQGIYEYYDKIIKVGLEDGFRLVLPEARKTDVQKRWP